MTTVDFRQENGVLSMEVRGHTGFADYGKDPVCAGASALAMTLAQCVLDMSDDGKLQKAAHNVVRPGRVMAVAKPRPEHYSEAQHLYQVILTGMQLLSESYPEHVTLQVSVTGNEPEEIEDSPTTRAEQENRPL